MRGEAGGGCDASVWSVLGFWVLVLVRPGRASRTMSSNADLRARFDYAEMECPRRYLGKKDGNYASGRNETADETSAGSTTTTITRTLDGAYANETAGREWRSPGKHGIAVWTDKDNTESDGPAKNWRECDARRTLQESTWSRRLIAWSEVIHNGLHGSGNAAHLAAICRAVGLSRLGLLLSRRHHDIATACRAGTPTVDRNAREHQDTGRLHVLQQTRSLEPVDMFTAGNTTEQD